MQDRSLLTTGIILISSVVSSDPCSEIGKMASFFQTFRFSWARVPTPTRHPGVRFARVKRVADILPIRYFCCNPNRDLTDTKSRSSAGRRRAPHGNEAEALGKRPKSGVGTRAADQGGLSSDRSIRIAGGSPVRKSNPPGPAAGATQLTKEGRTTNAWIPFCRPRGHDHDVHELGTSGPESNPLDARPCVGAANGAAATASAIDPFLEQ